MYKHKTQLLIKSKKKHSFLALGVSCIKRTSNERIVRLPFILCGSLHTGFGPGQEFIHNLYKCNNRLHCTCFWIDSIPVLSKFYYIPIKHTILLRNWRTRIFSILFVHGVKPLFWLDLNENVFLFWRWWLRRTWLRCDLSIICFDILGDLLFFSLHTVNKLTMIRTTSVKVRWTIRVDDKFCLPWIWKRLWNVFKKIKLIEE